MLRFHSEIDFCSGMATLQFRVHPYFVFYCIINAIVQAWLANINTDGMYIACKVCLLDSSLRTIFYRYSICIVNIDRILITAFQEIHMYAVGLKKASIVYAVWSIHCCFIRLHTTYLDGTIPQISVCTALHVKKTAINAKLTQNNRLWTVRQTI